MEHPIFNSEKYLNKIPEVDHSFSAEDLLKKREEFSDLDMPLKEVEYNEKGEIQVDKDGIGLDVFYSMPKNEAKEKFEKIFSGDDKKEFRSRARKIDKLILSHEKTGLQINFTELLL